MTDHIYGEESIKIKQAKFYVVRKVFENKRSFFLCAEF